MKLAIISTYPPRKCGIGIYTKRLADSMHGDIRVLSLKEHTYADKKALPMIDASLWSFLNAVSYIKKNGFRTVLIEHEYAFYSKIYFLLFLFLLKLRGIKTNIEMHTIAAYDDFIKKNIFRVYNFIMFLFCNRIIVHTEYARRKLLGAGMSKRKIRVLKLAIPNGKKLAAKRTGKIKLLCFGFIWHDKGTDIALRAFGSLKNIELKIVGSINPGATGKQRIYFENIKKMAQKHKNITVIDRFVSEQEKEKLYAEADFIILPYRMISQSAVLTEIWSHGKIPVSSDLAPLKEEIGKNEYGILFASSDAQALRNAVMSVAHDGAMQKRILLNIRCLAKKRSFTETARQIEELQ